ncbi:MAG: heme lyase CcmF/NrfE family subunit, partial [Burkholderiales bacterium]|nr:heme lyase CcmF/NrfE family subunit [Burkholderiales bacterium]
SWGSHEGSLLLWVLMLSGWMAAVARFSKGVPDDMLSLILGVMALVAIGFYSFLLLTSNPFDRLLPPAVDGRDLNPLLQDPGMVIHPPMLYMGYVGFSVVFAFAIAALISGRLDTTWARWSRPWTTIAWAFLTIGIALGSWWAYYELGWGGWWFWDPVENASFMPWLCGTALMHSLLVTEKRGSFKVWTVLLAIITFSLSLLGTFLVRSGVLTSVHAFATDPERGVFILGFLVFVVGASLILFAWRAPKVGLGGRFDLVSRESALLANNVLLVVAAASVLLGTLYPLFLDALGLGKISVGPPYFDAVFIPIMAPAMFLMGIGPISRWKKSSVPDLASKLKWAFVVSVVSALLLPFTMGTWNVLVSFGLLMALWIALAGIVNLWTRLKQMSRGEGNTVWNSLTSLPNSYYGMLCAHWGVAVFIVGVTLVNGYEIEKDVKMSVGNTVTIGSYTIRLDALKEMEGPNYTGVEGSMAILVDGEEVDRMFPQKRLYTVQQMAMTEAAIDTGFTRDLYISLGEPLSDGSWVVRVYLKPFVDWIWGGAFLMALGGILAVSDRRYRKASQMENGSEEVTTSS